MTMYDAPMGSGISNMIPVSSNSFGMMDQSFFDSSSRMASPTIMEHLSDRSKQNMGMRDIQDIPTTPQPPTSDPSPPPSMPSKKEGFESSSISPSFKESFQTFAPHGFYLALIYLVISGNYLGNLFGCRVQQMMSNNFSIKHLLGFLTTYFLIVLSSPPEGFSNWTVFGFTVIIYIWFFLTTKMNVSFWIPMILSVMAAYFLYIYNKQENQKENQKENQQEESKEASKEKIQIVQSVLVTLSAILTILGVTSYYGEKKLEYGYQFNPSTFWFGVNKDCRQMTPAISLYDSLSAAFR